MDNLVNISGVKLTPLKIIKNPLGNVLHGMKKSDIGYHGFEEAYFSTVKTGVIKPWKKHLEMTLNLIVPIGEIRFVLYDERRDSESKGEFMDVIMSIDNYCRLTIPPNIWVAFKGVGISTNLLLNIANLEHNPLEIVRVDINKFKYIW